MLQVEGCMASTPLLIGALVFAQVQSFRQFASACIAGVCLSDTDTDEGYHTDSADGVDDTLQDGTKRTRALLSNTITSSPFQPAHRTARLQATPPLPLLLPSPANPVSGDSYKRVQGYNPVSGDTSMPQTGRELLVEVLHTAFGDPRRNVMAKSSSYQRQAMKCSPDTAKCVITVLPLDRLARCAHYCDVFVACPHCNPHLQPKSHVQGLRSNGTLKEYVAAWNCICEDVEEFGDDFDIAEGSDDAIEMMACLKLQTHGTRVFEIISFPIAAEPDATGALCSRSVQKNM